MGSQTLPSALSPTADDTVAVDQEPTPPAEVGTALRIESAVRSEMQWPGVYGRLLDNQGQPLVGYVLRLSPNAAASSGRNTWSHTVPTDLLWSGEPLTFSGMLNPAGVTTDANGEFSFPGVSAGDYLLETVPFELATRPVTLAKNERLHVSFQLAANEVATTGQVLRSGEVQESLRLSLQQKDKHWPWSASADEGVYRIVLSAGEHTVGVIAPRSAVRPRVPCGRHRLVVPANQPRLDWTMILACTDLVVFARDERGMLPEHGQVTVRSLERDPMASNALTRPVRTKGTRFPLLAPGDYEVSVTGEQLATVPVQKLTVAAVNRRAELHFVVPCATTIRLLVKASGKALKALPANSMPVLRLAGADYPYGKIEHHGGRYGGRVYGFQKHPPGNAAIISEDRVLKGELQFLAFDPIPEQFVRVLLDQPNELKLTVTRRALVDLRACESGGREQFGASIEVFAGDRKVRSLSAKFCQRFRSYLPPGDYRVVIDRDGKRSESKLKVARRDIRLRLRP